MAFQFGIATPPFKPRSTMLADLTALSLTTNLKLVLDAGDSASYSSGQKWLDRSGGGYDFFLGADGSATATDPTFHGSVGGQSDDEYWTFDGGDYFTYDTTNETWMDNLHKDNATFSWAAWIYGRLTGSLFGTNEASNSNIGVRLRVQGPGFQTLEVTKGAGGSSFFQSATATVPAAEWGFVSGAVNEAANTFITNTSGTAESFACTYTTPSASSASFTMQIGAAGNGADKIAVAGSRMASLAIWEGTALSAANLAAIFTATRGKFGV